MTVEERLECLERRANRYRNALVLLVMSVCAVALIGATFDDGIIRGKELWITNSEGKDVIYAGFDTDGDGLLRVLSKTGKDVIWAGADPWGDGRLKVYGKTGKELIYAGGDGDGNGRIVVVDDQGDRAVVIYAKSYYVGRGGGQLNIYNQDSGILPEIEIGGNSIKIRDGRIALVGDLYWSTIDNGHYTLRFKRGDKWKDLIKIGPHLDWEGGAGVYGGAIQVMNQTEDSVVQLLTDEYGNGVVYAGNRKGKGKTLQPGP